MKRLCVLSGGHPYHEAAFADLIASLAGWTVEHRVHPDAEQAVGAGWLEGAGAVLFYDMGGYRFGDGAVAAEPPSAAFRAGVTRYLAGGGGAVALHHALAGWARWPEWSDLLGGRFLYQPDEVRGRPMLDSGYRHDVAYEAVALAPGHPVLTGLPPRFPMVDELYLAEVFEDEVVPLLRAEHAFVADNFYSAAHAVAGRMFDNRDWPHPPGSALIAWERPLTAGRLIYLQPGDGPATYANPHFRRLLGNALATVAS